MESKMDHEEHSLSLIHSSDHDDAPREQAMQEDTLTPWSLDYATNNFDTGSEGEQLFENYIMGGSGPTILVSCDMDLSLLDYGVVSGGGLNTMPDENATTNSNNTCWPVEDDLEMLDDDEPMPDRAKSFLFQHPSAMTCNHNWMNTPMTSAEWDRIREEEAAEVTRCRHHQRTGGEKTDGEQINETPRALSHWTSTAWDYDESH